MTEMVRPAFPACPTCSQTVHELEGFGARITAQPCGHPVHAEFGAGGVRGNVILRSREDDR